MGVGGSRNHPWKSVEVRPLSLPPRRTFVPPKMFGGKTKNKKQKKGEKRR